MGLQKLVKFMSTHAGVGIVNLDPEIFQKIGGLQTLRVEHRLAECLVEKDVDHTKTYKAKVDWYKSQIRRLHVVNSQLGLYCYQQLCGLSELGNDVRNTIVAVVASKETPSGVSATNGENERGGREGSKVEYGIIGCIGKTVLVVDYVHMFISKTSMEIETKKSKSGRGKGDGGGKRQRNDRRGVGVGRLGAEDRKGLTENYLPVVYIMARNGGGRGFVHICGWHATDSHWLRRNALSAELKEWIAGRDTTSDMGMQWVECGDSFGSGADVEVRLRQSGGEIQEVLEWAGFMCWYNTVYSNIQEGHSDTRHGSRDDMPRVVVAVDTRQLSVDKPTQSLGRDDSRVHVFRYTLSVERTLWWSGELVRTRIRDETATTTANVSKESSFLMHDVGIPGMIVKCVLKPVYRTLLLGSKRKYTKQQNVCKMFAAMLRNDTLVVEDCRREELGRNGVSRDESKEVHDEQELVAEMQRTLTDIFEVM